MQTTQEKYIRFYYEKFLKSIDVNSMDTTEVGAYCLLLFHSIEQKRPGYLPEDEESLMRISKLSEEQWVKCRKRLLKKFDHSDKGYCNKAMVAELKRAEDELNKQQISDKASESAAMGVDFKIKDKTEELHTLQRYISDGGFRNVKRIPFQLTYKQCDILLRDLKFPSQLIADKLVEMENDPGIYKKRDYVFHTLKIYCERALK